jgi:hypothetical protein
MKTETNVLIKKAATAVDKPVVTKEPVITAAAFKDPHAVVTNATTMNVSPTGVMQATPSQDFPPTEFFEVVSTSEKPLFLEKGIIDPGKRGLASQAEISIHYQYIQKV